MSNKTGKIPSSTFLTGSKLGTLGMKVQSSKKVSLEENKEGWTLVKRRHRTIPQLPSPSNGKRKLRNNQRRRCKARPKMSAKSTGVEVASRVLPRLPTLGNYFPKSFFINECFTTHVINVEEKDEAMKVLKESSKHKQTIS